jgi:hypothetical protein
MRALSRSATILLLAAAAVTVSGCSGGTSSGEAAGTASPAASSPASATTPPPVMSSPSPPPTSAAPSSPSSTCGPSTGEAAAADAIAALALPSGLESAKWDAAGADYSGYDPCAALSWSVVSLEMATGSSPCAILLFHEGTSLGTATKVQYGFVPQVERTAPGAILVTYRYLKDGEATADASGRAAATFTWNPETESVDMAGETPPVS